MSEEIEEVTEEATMVEPDMSSGCGCNKNKTNGSEGLKRPNKNKVLTIVLAIMIIGTIIYMLRNKKVPPIVEVPKV